MNKSNVQSNNDLNKEEEEENVLTDQSSDISEISSSHIESTNDNSLNQQLSFLNQISFTCPECSGNIKPVFVPLHSHIQTGSGSKRREVVLPTLIINQLGSGKAKAKPKRKTVKRNNKPRKKPRKNNQKRKSSKTKAKKTSKNKSKTKSRKR